MENCLTLDHPLFLIIKQEHQVIEKLLQEVISGKDEQLKRLMELWVYAELKHHHKEEKYLFSRLAETKRIQEGGPRCSFYFDLYRLRSPLETVEKLFNLKIPLEEHQKIFYEKNLPVKIPTDEHRAGKMILQQLVANYETFKASRRQELLFEYQEIQLLHIKKEETCLFHLCLNIMTRSEADQVLASWQLDGDF